MPAAPCSYCGSTEGPDHICPGQNMQLIGQVLDGRYRIEDVLGQGGMGMVFRANQTSVQRPVAVKTLHPALAAAPQFFERFRREAELASKLRHPNIITIYDFGRTPDGTCYYVMELLDGVSLRQLVKQEGPLPVGRAVDLVEQAARALGHAHEQGVVHRDVKPHNIMVQRLERRDFVKVLDFGLVKAMEQDEHQQLTSTGQVLGTPQYMPPEQAGGEVVDHRSDLYSLAGVLYFCLTGSSPFGANTVRKALQASLTQTVPPVGKKRQGAPVPHAVDEFFRKALAREKEDRYQSAEEFMAELREAIAGMSPEALEARPTPADPSAPAREGSGSGASPRNRGTVASRRGSGSSRSVRPAPSNIVVDPQIHAPAQRSASRPPPPPSQGTSPGRLALYVGVPLVIALFVAGFLLFGPKEAGTVRRIEIAEVSTLDPAPTRATGTPVRTPARPSETLSVHFESDPPGAGIYEGDVQIGTTPVDLVVERGRVHVLTFRLAGYEPVARTLDFSRQADDRATVQVALKKVQAPPQVQPASGKRRSSGSSGGEIPVFD